mmetsp:Transcript_34024/g.67358  ORF Transcript_34024/g.67358 Transcript_34024/m.67358 type:complete len:229 (+) Transcript_34024:339-1025(+)
MDGRSVDSRGRYSAGPVKDRNCGECRHRVALISVITQPPEVLLSIFWLLSNLPIAEGNLVRADHKAAIETLRTLLLSESFDEFVPLASRDHSAKLRRIRVSNRVFIDVRRHPSKNRHSLLFHHFPSPLAGRAQQHLVCGEEFLHFGSHHPVLSLPSPSPSPSPALSFQLPNLTRDDKFTCKLCGNVHTPLCHTALQISFFQGSELIQQTPIPPISISTGGVEPVRIRD